MGTKLRKSALAVSLVISLSILAFLTLFSYSSFYKGIKYRASDFKTRNFYDKSKAGKDVAIIAIDEHSIKEFSEKYNYNWPWPRQFYGILINYLKQAGADVVVFDMLFNEKEIERTDIDSDDSEGAFADAMKDYGKTIIGSMISQEKIHPGKVAIPELDFTDMNLLPAKNFKSLTRPIDKLLQNSKTGVVTLHTDDDGVCRRLPLIFKAGGKYYPQLAFAAYLTATSDKIVKYDEKLNTIVTDKSYFRLDKNGYKKILWNGPGGTNVRRTYKYYSFFDLFISATQLMAGTEPRLPLKIFKGKKLVVCATAAGLMDLKPTPFTAISPYPGGEIHATLLDNLLQGSEVIEPPGTIVKIITLILLVLICHIFIKRSLHASILITTASCAIIVCASFYLYYYYSIDIEYVFPVLSILIASTVVSMYKMLTEGRERRQLRSIFSRYLHQDVIEILMENPDKIDLKGTELVATVLFTDLQGFTTYAEDKTPQELIDVLNKYFQVITNIVLDRGGMLDKYTGDGIMAIFGAPVEKKDHARAACETILSFRDRNVNKLISSEKGDILTRIGISSGPIVVGNLGSERRMDFTAIGDTVNLSARLEGVNKAYGTTNIMSEYTWAFVKDDYFFRELDYIRVKGKKHPIRVFTLVNRIDEMDEKSLEIESKFEAAIKLYRNRHWVRAIDAFNEVLTIYPEDSPSKAYIERCRLLQTNSELVDSQGVFTFKTK